MSTGRMSTGKKAALGLLAAAVLLAGAWGLGLRKAPGEAVAPLQREESIGFTMGTVARVVAEGPAAGAAVAAVMQELDRLTVLLDRFRPFGDVAALNGSGGEWVTVSAEVLALLEEAVRLAELSGGAFDPTVAPVVDLWGFVEEGTYPEEEAHEHHGHGDEARPHGVPAGEPPGVLSGTGSGDAAESAAGGESGQGPARSGTSPTRLIGYAPPDPGELAAALARVDFRGLEIDAENSRARLARPGQAIDLGAIAKGYGVDRAVQLLKEHGVVRALVDLGGDVYALGTRPDGTPWRLGIRHPRRAGQILGILHVSDAAVATSGDYERYFEYEGVRYSHIVDPRTGWPAMELASVTVVAPHGVWADALSTAVFVLGKEEGLALLESLPGVEGILVDKDLNVLITSGLEGKVDLLEGQ